MKSRLYDIAWWRLKLVLKSKIRPFANRATSKFDSIRDPFDRAADVDTKLEPSSPG